MVMEYIIPFSIFNRQIKSSSKNRFVIVQYRMPIPVRRNNSKKRNSAKIKQTQQIKVSIFLFFHYFIFTSV